MICWQMEVSFTIENVFQTFFFVGGGVCYWLKQVAIVVIIQH